MIIKIFNQNSKIKTVLAIVLPLSCALLKAGDVEIRFEDSPLEVQKTIRAQSMNQPVEEVERFSFDGREIYIAEVRLGRDKDLKVYVSSNGNLLKIRRDVDEKSLPDSVKKALAGRKGFIEDIEMETREGVVTYHIEIDRRSEGDLDLVIASDGKIIEEIVEPED